MIQPFVDAFMSNRDELALSFVEDPPRKHADIVGRVLRVIADDKAHPRPDADDFTIIGDDDHQGRAIYIFSTRDHRNYWVLVSTYGTCSACDAFKSAEEIGDLSARTSAYVNLALHAVQQITAVPDPEDEW